MFLSTAALELAHTTDWVKTGVEFTAVVNDPTILVDLHWAGSGDLFVDDIALEQLAD